MKTKMTTVDKEVTQLTLMEKMMSWPNIFKNQLKRLALSSAVAAAMFASGLSVKSAYAGSLPAWGEGVIITPASAPPDTRSRS